ncbi:MAG: hypothetical protein KIH01_07290 [Candidatus Freyarchaeota archaeon]|nr:hypothetical protein [Candidatus Jordarchaeia archaeon]
MKDPKELLVYLLLRSMKEATLDELAEAAGIPRRSAVRILRSFIRRGVAREAEGKVLFNPQCSGGLRAPFGGDVVELNITVDRDLMKAGEVRVYRGEELVASMPCIFSGEDFVIDLSGFLEFYGKVAREKGSPFSVKKAYNVFRRLMEGRGEVKSAGQWEIDAALGAILLCGAVAEELGLDYIITTIDSSSIPRRVELKELEDIGETNGVDFVAGYYFPLGRGEGLLLVDRAGRTYFSKRGGALVELEVSEEGDMVEVDFTKLVDFYVKLSEENEANFSAEKVVDYFFSTLEEGSRIEDCLKLVEHNERELLEAMYRISVLVMRLRGKDVIAKVTYLSFSGGN